MIADINDGAPKNVRYIHWRITGHSLSVNQILCYEKKRMYDTDVSGSYDYILPKNGGIPDTRSCSSIGSNGVYISYNGYHTIWRTIVFNDNGIWTVGNAVYEDFEMENDSTGEAHQCDLDTDQHGYDCYTKTNDNALFPHDKMKVTAKGSNADRAVCAIVLIEDADECSEFSIASQMVSSVSYTIGAAAATVSFPTTVTVNSCATTCTV